VSAVHDEPHPDESPGDSSSSDETLVAGTPVVVRRNAGLAALIGAGASAIAIAYLWRASQSGALVDWALCLSLALIAAFYLSSLVDSRTPLVVADDLGVRIRLGGEWRGLPWDAVNQVVVQPRRGLLRDGRLIFSPRSLGRALDGLDSRGRRQAALNQKMYGAAMAVPLGLTTRLSTDGHRALVDGIAALALGRAEVVVLEPTPKARQKQATPVIEEPEVLPHDLEMAPRPVEEAAPEVVGLDLIDDLAGSPREELPGTPTGLLPSGRRRVLGGIGTIVSRVAKGRGRDLDSSPEPAIVATATATNPASLNHAATTAVALRSARPALRAEVTRELPATLGKTSANAVPQTGLHPETVEDARPTSLPEDRELHRLGSVDLVFEQVQTSGVRQISQLGEPVEPLVVDDFVTEPAYDPVIGPELAAARTRVGLSVDELADRTRIRPHVIESIEVDDFAPCGGDFYARGHLRTLARVLGQDVDPMLAKFEERYATAPVNARRVFEAELATGMTGSMRSTVGGPNWGLLIGAVLMLVLVWGVVRLFEAQPVEHFQSPAPVLNGSAGFDRSFPLNSAVGPAKKPLQLILVGSRADSNVVVRDGSGKIIYAGLVVLGENKPLKATPPVHVSATNAGAIEVRVGGRDRGSLGELGQPGRRTFRPAR
jgi:cytoskeleton protein RodZ